MELFVLENELAVHRLEAGADIPPQVFQASFFAVTRTAEELSIVCDEALAMPSDEVEPGWVALKVAGPLDFGLTGILASIANPLAAAGIPIFALSTYDTDYILVKKGRLPQAFVALRAAGHKIVE